MKDHHLGLSLVEALDTLWPQDEAGLIALLGGDRKALAKLDVMFDDDTSGLDYSHAEDIAGLIGQYIHGNEPSHHVAYLYDFAGAPWRTQARLGQIVASQDKPAPDGLAGNDDLGQMSARLVFTALVFFPVATGSNEYVIGRPFVDRAVLRLPNGRRFVVAADGLSPANRYVGAVTINGVVLDRSYVKDAELRAGGELRFTMGALPNKRWATGRKARPFPMSGGPEWPVQSPVREIERCAASGLVCRAPSRRIAPRCWLPVIATSEW